MTKHLRLIMLSLLAMICMGGYSQEKSVTCTLTGSGETIEPKGELVLSYSRTTDGKNKNGYYWNCDKGEVTVTAKLKDSNAKISQIVANAKCGRSTPKLEVTVGKTSLGQKTLTTSNKDYEFPCEQGLSGDINLLFTGKAPSSPGSYFLKTITVYYTSSNQTSTNTTFGTNYDGKTFNFVNGVLEGWNAPTATHTPADVAGTITYTSDKEAVATVDQNAQLTFTGYGTATITATFTPKDTKTYAASSASYTVINKDPYIVDVVFVASVDKGKTTVTGKDEMSKNGVSIQSENAALGNGENYRFYQNITAGHTFSVKRGFITKIVFEGGTSSYSLKNLKLKDQKNGAITTSSVNKATWEGEAKSVVFTTSGQARATKITVTVKVPVAKDYTLDENSVNTIEAYENANVTLKRTFYKDGEWNTLCLPFDVADAKTAFDGAELREVDAKNSHDNTIVFKEATTIEAGKPYLIKWAKTPNEVCDFVNTFEGVTLVATATPVKVNDAITFTGFYNKATADKLGASVAAIGAGNKLFKVTSGEMKGFRAAFVLNPATPAAGIKVVIDGTTTGIEDLVVDGVKANGRVYNLNGQYVGNSLNGLQPGIYIQNGKKVVVK